MEIIQHPSNNAVFSAPKGMTIDECSAAPVTRVAYTNGQVGIRTYWKPSQTEILELNLDGYVMLSIIGEGMPPVFVGTVSKDAEL